MPREKNIRKLNFKPITTSFVPKEQDPCGTTSLLHEEIEAIYMMDVLGLYQEDAAKSMEISRPTFTRILKNARQKLATALVGGYEINIEDSKDDLVIAFCSSDKQKFENIDLLQQFILFFRVKDNSTELIKVIDNHVNKDRLKPAIVLPKVLLDNRVNIFISSKIGEGLKNSLISKGIKPIIRESLDLDSLSNIK
jgi:predicted DNA-binding protein (UPF0251 family)